MPEHAIRLRRFATGLLLLMALLLLFSTWAARALYPGFSWLQSFAEAALVGGLADWFAVTALFRHPMGLPIPHTAIIPRSKDRIGDALASFLNDNFLTPTNVARRLQRIDLAASIAAFLDQAPAIRRPGLGALARELAATPAAAILAERARSAAMERLSAWPLAPLLGRLLRGFVAEGRHQPLLDRLIAWASATIDSEEERIRRMVDERTGWLLKLVRLDDRIADELLSGLRALLAELAADPLHPVREKARRGLLALARQLEQDPALQAHVEQWKNEALNSAVVRASLHDAWQEILASLRTQTLTPQLGALGPSIARSLRQEPALRLAANRLLRRAIAGLAGRYGQSIVSLVPATVRGWDAATVTDKVEGAVLRDLQYIRLNGTLIGGLIGLALHAALSLS